MTKKPVLVTLADKNYLEYAKQVFASSYFNAGWKGDFLLLAYEVPEKELHWFRQKGIFIKKCKSFLDKNYSNRANILFNKIYLFCPDFKRWSHVVFLDADTIIRSSLDDLLKVKKIAAVPNLEIKFGWFFRKNNFISQHNPNKVTFCSGILVFNTEIIKSYDCKDFIRHIKKFKEFKKEYNEEAFLNLYFYNRWQKLPRIYNVYTDRNLDLWHMPASKLKAIIIHSTRIDPWEKGSEFYEEWIKNYQKAEEINLRKITKISKWPKTKIIIYSSYLETRYKIYKNNYYYRLMFFVEKKFPHFFSILKKSKRFIIHASEAKSVLIKHPVITLGMIKEKKSTILGMTSDWEQAYLRWYAKEKYSGKGEIIDLGCWLGATSVALAEGLSQNIRVNRRKRIHAFDKFIWTSSTMERSIKNSIYVNHFKNHQSFYPEFCKNIKPFKEYIKAHQVDIRRTNWGRNKVELLFIDASKSWELIDKIIKIFFPYLIPKRSIRVEQDFAYYKTYWIHLISFKFRDYFKPISQVPESPSVIFKLRKIIPPQLLNAKYSLSSFSEKDIELAFEYSQKLVNGYWKIIIMAAKTMCYLDLGKFKDAEELFSKIKKAIDYDVRLRDHLSDFWQEFNQRIKNAEPRKTSSSDTCR